MDFHIIPECYVDTNLIETIVPPNGVVLLMEWINYLKAHPYDADLDFFR